MEAMNQGRDHQYYDGEIDPAQGIFARSGPWILLPGGDQTGRTATRDGDVDPFCQGSDRRRWGAAHDAIPYRRHRGFADLLESPTDEKLLLSRLPGDPRAVSGSPVSSTDHSVQYEAQLLLCATFHSPRTRLQVVQPDSMQKSSEISSFEAELMTTPTCN